jgi:hypothetical protein
VMLPRYWDKNAGAHGCGGPCPGAGVLAWRDAEATFDSYCPQVAQLVDQTILKMGLPSIDHLGRRLGKGAEAARDEEAAWGVRRQLRDPNTKLIPSILLEVQAELFATVRSGRACLFHLRGLMFRITERTTWRMASKRALELMRERLLGKDETPPDGGPAAADLSPEMILLADEQRLTEQRMLAVVESEMSRLSATTAAIFGARTQDPPRPYEDLASEFGLSPGACRKRFHEARARMMRLLKPGS